MKLSEMARLFGVGSDGAVSRAISRFDAELLDDSEKSGIYKSINQELTPKILRAGVKDGISPTQTSYREILRQYQGL